MNAPEKDKSFFAAGLQELEPYLLSNELYWHTPAQTSDFTQMTLGALLLVGKRLEGQGVLGAADLASRLDAIRSKWRAAWEGKARREVRARSELWKDYVAARDVSPGRYAYQSRLRAILTLLLDDLREPPSELLNSLDAQLRQTFRAGAFVWDAELQSAFPQDRFWYLYGAIHS